ncbi:MAG: outer membrane lipoprotein carrier protein LolA [Deltaproteobacteria bacterium]|jgi:outer membrane lipoprotein carrier protein|nr:outer membrane lipoprotein carrier protein LolA [Deltaproteobacteria bacterium]
MKISLLNSLVFISLVCVLAHPAAAASLSDVIKTLETPFQHATGATERINDYDAEFFQESRIASLDRLQRARGQVSVAFDYRIPGQVPTVLFRWQYEEPTNQEMVSDGKTLWVYLPENNQVIQSDIELVNQARQNDPMTFLTGLGNLSRDFQIRWAQPNFDIDGNYVLELTPRKSSALINRLLIVVDRLAVEAYLQRQQGETPTPVPAKPDRAKDLPAFDEGFQVEGAWFPILSTSVYDPNGNSTIIEFSNIRVNTGVPRTKFNFMMPAGVQVVRPTGKEMGF